MSSKPPLNRRMTRKLEYADLDAAESAPEDALVIAECLLRIKNAVADMPRRADGCVNAHDLWVTLDAAFDVAEKEAHEG